MHSWKVQFIVLYTSIEINKCGLKRKALILIRGYADCGKSILLLPNGESINSRKSC